jgi:hypothetical protein
MRKRVTAWVADPSILSAVITVGVVLLATVTWWLLPSLDPALPIKDPRCHYTCCNGGVDPHRPPISAKLQAIIDAGGERPPPFSRGF